MGQESTAIRRCVIDSRTGEAFAAGAGVRRYDLRTGEVAVVRSPVSNLPISGGWNRVREGHTVFWSDREALIQSRDDSVPYEPLAAHCDAAVILGGLRLVVAERDEQGQPSIRVSTSFSAGSPRMFMRRPARTLWMDSFGPNGFAHGRDDGIVELTVASSDVLTFLELSGHTGPVLHGAVVPGDLQLVTAGADLTVRIWSIGSEPLLQGSLSALCEGHTDQITGLAVTPDGQCVATSSRDRTIRLWSIPDGRSLGVLTEHRDWVTHVTINPAGTHLASCSEDGTIKVWDLDSQECVGTAYGVSRFLCLGMSRGTVCAGDAAGNFWMLQYGDLEDEDFAPPVQAARTRTPSSRRPISKLRKR